jgi:hypothetical protein
MLAGSSQEPVVSTLQSFYASMVATMLLHADKERKRKSFPSSRAWAATNDRENPLNQDETPPARRRRPTGALIPSVLNPGPLPLGPGFETRPTDRSQKSSRHATLLAGQKRGGAVAHPQSAQGRRRTVSTEERRSRCLRCASIQTKGEFSKKEKSSRQRDTLTAIINARARG